MQSIGRALARLAARIGGQVMLELPDDLDPSFVASLLDGANLEVSADPSFALFVRDQRRDVGAISPVHDFHELAMFRQGSRLAVTFASDNRGMATYSSVYPLLLSNGFPASQQGVGGAGVACLADFAEALGEVLEDRQEVHGLASAEFRKAIREILAFLAGAHETVGNGQASFAADWWLHIGEWVTSLALQVPAGDPVGLPRLYGCAGIPVPIGDALTMTSKEYVGVLQARWSDPTVIMGELGRLRGIERAQAAAVVLSTLDWEASHSATSLRTDSLISRVAVAADTDRALRIRGWSALREDDFKDSFVDAKGRLRILRAGADLPSPWKGASPVLVAKATELPSDAGHVVELGDIGLIIPFKDGANPSSLPVNLSNLATAIRIAGTKQCELQWDAVSYECVPEGLRLTGALRVEPAPKVPNVVVLEISCTGAAAAALVDRCSGTFTLLRPHEAALWARPDGRGTRSTQRGPFVWSKYRSENLRLELPAPGKYELALAWGEQSGIGTSSLRIGTTAVNEGWAEMEDVGAKEVLDIVEAIDVVNAGDRLFRVELAIAADRPLSPIVAAANGVLPNTKRILGEGTLGHLEEVLGKCLNDLKSMHGLGCVLADDTKARGELGMVAPGIYATSNLAGRDTDLSPGFPSSALLNHSAYIRLREAYISLGIPSILTAIETDEGISGLTESRIPFDRIPRASLEELLEAYQALLSHLGELAASDKFWARHPFSVVVFPDGIGMQSARAVLLSPLHPVRLAWSWSVQVGLRGAFDDGVTPASSLALLDGTAFPAYCVVEDAFGTASPLMPIAIDAHPADLYLGWHASVAVLGGRPTIPEHIAGRRFPVDGLSTLSASSVGAAIDDFLRVSPHVQALRLELTAASPARRSSAIDDGILAKLESLALSSTSLDGVAGVHVYDSANRIGPLPRFDGLEEAIALARPGFNAEWTSVIPTEAVGGHVTFLEGSAAQIGLDRATDQPRGWLPQLPLRRIPHRVRRGNFVALDYALAEPATHGNSFARTLMAYESSMGGASYVLKVIPNLAGVTSRPSWLVAADFGVDPQSLSQAATLRADADYVLWDWRPATAVKANGDTGGRVQPYFVLAAIPEALNNAIRDRLRSLKGGIDADEINRRAKLLISTLAERAIGLNTLLAIGHHQATGALGFYFVLRSLAAWMNEGTPGDVRLVIPVDAVDPFVRMSTAGAGDGSRRRADLLAIRAWVEPGKNARVVIMPIEIKHYGLSAGESAASFPVAGESRLEGHVDQLRQYQRQLAQLCDRYNAAAGGEASILGQRIAALIDAAIQLSPLASTEGNSLLSSIASGRAQVELGKGILAWYQAGGTSPEGAKAEWEEVSGTAETRRIDIRVDPAAFDACFWGTADGPCHAVVREALESASIVGDEGFGIDPNDDESHPPEPDGGSPTAPQATVANEEAPTIDPAGVANTREDVSPLSPIASSAKANEEESGQPERPSEASKVPVVTTEGLRVRLLPAELEKRYKSLLGALSEFGVKVERPLGQAPYQEGPGFIEYAVQPAYGVSVSRVESQIDNLKLRMKLPADAVIGCSTHLGNIRITVPKADAERYFVDAEEMWGRWVSPSSGFFIPLGEDVSGEIVSLDLASSNSPHILISGVTGSGKSEALLTMLHGAARFNSPSELQFLLVDPKQTELTSLSSLPHTQGEIGWTSEDAIAFLERAVEEMENRYTAFKAAGAGVRNISEFRSSGREMARWLVVLDEYADLVSDDDDRAKIEKSIKRLSQKARAAGIHLVVSTQKPVVTVVNTVVKGNLPGRIALRVNSVIESRVVLDEAGAEQLVGKGDAIVKSGNNRHRVQFARYVISGS